MEYCLRIELMSDTCFSGGYVSIGEVDVDIEQEEQTGLPLLRGRTLKGLLVEECAMIVKTLSDTRWMVAAAKLFGEPGRKAEAALTIGDALLPEAVRTAAQEATQRPVYPLSPRQILESLTDVRFQTKISPLTGAPEEHSLRATRVALKGLVLYSAITGADRLPENERALFAACVLATRRGGLNRNRGWGKLRIRVLDGAHTDVTPDWVASLQHQTGG